MPTRYCAACGQRDFAHNPSAHVLVGELWDTFGTIDGKLVRTASLLVTRPGALTVEWLAGRRAPYLRPFNLYLTVSGAYFAALAATFRPGQLVMPRTAEQRRESERVRATFERKYGSVPPPQRVVMLGLGRFVADPASGITAAMPTMPRVMFALVPVLALLVQLAFRKRGWRYPAHLYFALHVLAFYFAVSIVDRVAHSYGPPWVGSLANAAVGVATLVYLGFAMRRVYGGRRWVTVTRTLAIGSAFAFLAILGVWVNAVLTLGLR